MKTILRFSLLSILLPLGQSVFPQCDKSLNSKFMVAESNKKVIEYLYKNILNKRNFQEFENIISKNYSNYKGAKGIDGFKTPVLAFTDAFPDAKWTITEIVAEGNKVFVKQKIEGTHKGIFQGIQPTNRFISSEGMGIFELNNGKVVSHQIQTNQLGFLQQLGVIPKETSQIDDDTIFFVDRFTMPKSSFSEFFKRMEMNRSFIRNLEGFIRDEKMIREEPNGNIVVLTVAIWKNQKFLDNAKIRVQEQYKRIGFDPVDFYEKFSISMRREIFKNTLQ